jgi:hyaluronoglucosaminidase
VRGIIEGFYGTPWSWELRRAICAELAGVGMDTYVYAPKDDPLHRDRWRDPYPDEELAAFAELVGSGSLRVGIGISPGLSMDPGSEADRRELLAKVHQLTGTGISLVGLLLDDLDPAPGLGQAHGELTRWLRDALDPSVELFMVPLHYTGTAAPPYLEELGATVPEAVPIGWTGRYVVNRTITAADARAWREAMDGRRPLLWDNTPVNDALMTEHLFTGPLRGREPGLVDELSGYLANPMVQARASLPALRSAAAWLRGEDPEDAWQDAVGANRTLMEGCDGAAPGALADAGLHGDDAALAELEGWFAEAERCDAGDLGEEVGPWVEQLRAEAAVARVAVPVLRAEQGEARRLAPLLLFMWPQVRASATQVLGGRGSLVPAMGQDDRSRWVAAPESYIAPGSVTDRLVAAAFARL